MLCLVVGYYLRPKEVWATVANNCRDAGGNPRPRYIIQELKDLASFYLRIAALAAMITTCVLPLVVLGDQIMPLTIAAEIVGEGEVSAESARNFAKHHQARGGTSETAADTLAFIWHALPWLFLLSFFATVVSLRYFMIGYEQTIKAFADDQFEREFRRLKRRYLRDGPDASCEVIV